MVVTDWTLAATVSVTVIGVVGQIDGVKLLKEGVGLADIGDELPVANDGVVYVMFSEIFGITEGVALVILTGGMITGTATFAEQLGMVTEITVPDDTVKLPTVGGITTVSVTGGLEVMLLDCTGTMSDGTGTLVEIPIDEFAGRDISVNVPIWASSSPAQSSSLTMVGWTHSGPSL